MPFYFIFGEESFLVEEHVQVLVTQHANHTIERLQGAFSLETLRDYIQTQSLFSEQNLILVKDPWFFKRAPTDSDMTILSDVFDQVGQSGHTLVIYQMGSVDQRKKVVTLIKKTAKTSDYKAYKDWEQDKVLAWLSGHVKKKGYSIRQDALWALEQIGGTNLRQMASELEKITVYIAPRTEISLVDVKAIAAGAQSSLFKFNEAMKKRSLKGVLSATHSLFKSGEDPIRLLGMVTANIRLYLQLLSLVSEGKSVQEIGKLIGKNPFFLKRLIPEVKRHYSLAQLYSAYQKLALCDLNIKSGKCRPQASMLLTLTAICQ